MNLPEFNEQPRRPRSYEEARNMNPIMREEVVEKLESIRDAARNNIIIHTGNHDRTTEEIEAEMNDFLRRMYSSS